MSLQRSIHYARIDISQYNESGELYIYGCVPIPVGICGSFLKEKGTIPETQNTTIALISPIGTDTKGIFVVAGSPKKLRALQDQFENPRRHGKRFDEANFTVFDAGAILLRYLLQLPESVIPHAWFERFIEPLAHSSMDGRNYLPRDSLEDTTKAYEALFMDLPTVNRHVLYYLLDLLAVIASKSCINDMTTARLAALFQPAILQHPQHEWSYLEMGRARDVLIFLIDNQDRFPLSK